MGRDACAWLRLYKRCDGFADDVVGLVPIDPAQHKSLLEESDQPVVLPRRARLDFGPVCKTAGRSWDGLPQAAVDEISELSEQRKARCFRYPGAHNEKQIAGPLSAQQGQGNVGSIFAKEHG